MVRRSLLAVVAAALLAGSAPAVAAPHPDAGPGTRLIDRDAKLDGFVDPAWYRANIPFVDLPGAEIEDTYYYRWRTFKEALKYTGPEDGWIVSEFLGPVGYSAPGGGISAAAGHHLYEGRWLRDTRYLDDYLDYWLTGSGAGPKPATEPLNPNTTDWAHQYSFWVSDAVVARASVDGRWDRATAALPELVEQWEGWDSQFDPELGLYWQTPVWDAMEHTASSYQSDDPYHGGEGFRPTINAYQYGDARAIANLLRRTGDLDGAAEFETRAAHLKSNVDEHLRDGDFYKHVMRDGNPAREPIADREQIGFVPWYFGMAPPEADSAWSQLTDPQGFAAPHGPTTVERRSPWYLHEAEEGCCRWSGPSWPYATSQTLTALANRLHDRPEQPHVDRQDYYDLLRGYASTQRKDGRPYVAEAHHPDEDRWLYDARGHSEDYNHSTFTDLVLSGLLGIRPQQDDTARIAPLVPAGWDHFAVEDVPYRGHDLSVSWDRDGSHYGQGSGLRISLDGGEIHRQDDLGPVTVPVTGAASEPPRMVDDLVNADGTGFPEATASYSGEADDPGEAIDGQDFHLDVPGTRWTNHGSPNHTDHLQVDLAEPIDVSDVRISFYDDGKGVRTPDSYRLQHRRDGEWVDLPTSPPRPGEPGRVVVDPPVRTDALRVTPLREDGGAVGITAFQSWRPAE
ncbi:discoidin domain-containing protein [Saccharopolyspora sp. NFXS83]|uniref:discoidin domain-containing protein n=1 Tax=Saccharopolyspora sp. NFXS83 TaxID=2993560 RepID=UPI00224AAEB6|nr:discoidin domain-containing protein [Saccharopolyspora sp. NFXS83]MCX2733824.1 discoidin domain-containing protein [Saccharopolyspora sp. NFXS83]